MVPVRWVDPPALIIPEGADDKPHPAAPSEAAEPTNEMGDGVDDDRVDEGFIPFAGLRAQARGRA
jgi:hypothetical protein